MIVLVPKLELGNEKQIQVAREHLPPTIIRGLIPGRHHNAGYRIGQIPFAI